MKQAGGDDRSPVVRPSESRTAMTRTSLGQQGAAAAALLLLVTLAAAAAQQTRDSSEEKSEYLRWPMGSSRSLRSGHGSLGLVPFPRVGKRGRSVGLVPFPRVGRAKNMGLVPFPRVGKRGRSVGLVPFPRVGRTKSMGLVPFPRVGRRDRTMGLVPFPRVGRADPALVKKQSLIPYPRIGKKSSWDEAGAMEEPQYLFENAPLDDGNVLEADMGPEKRNWDTPRLGGYKRSGCGTDDDCDDSLLLSSRLQERSDSSLVPRLGGE